MACIGLVGGASNPFPFTTNTNENLILNLSLAMIKKSTLDIVWQHCYESLKRDLWQMSFFLHSSPIPPAPNHLSHSIYGHCQHCCFVCSFSSWWEIYYCSCTLFYLFIQNLLWCLLGCNQKFLITSMFERMWWIIESSDGKWVKNRQEGRKSNKYRDIHSSIPNFTTTGTTVLEEYNHLDIVIGVKSKATSINLFLNFWLLLSFCFLT